jgi:YjbE family integral membrane protein
VNFDDISSYISHFELHRAAAIALIQVILVDITLAGDNALVIGMTATRVAPHHRRIVILFGLLAALVLRIALAYFAVELLGIVGVTFVGGVVLLWISGRLYQGIAESKLERERNAAGDTTPPKHVGLLRAIGLIAIADLSMSADNVLAVAGIAQPLMKSDPWILFVGITFAVLLMGIAATFIAKLLQRAPLIAYIGVALIAYVAVRMIAQGGGEIFTALHAG